MGTPARFILGSDKSVLQMNSKRKVSNKIVINPLNYEFMTDYFMYTEGKQDMD